MEAVNLTTRVATAVFNADPCPNPDPSLPCFGLPAPRPGWVRPVARRDSTQTDGAFRETGIDEYHASRGMAWSASQNLFYISDELGIFKLNTEGDCTFLARPAFPSDGSQDNSKAIAFVKVGNQTKLFVGHRNGVGANGALIEIDPASGDVNSEVPLTYPPGGADEGQFGGLLGMDQHPVTGVLYGIRKVGNNFARELVTINPSTGATTFVGNMGMHMASITFVATPQFDITSVSRNGNVLTLTWSGGSPPYQVQTNTTTAEQSWVNSGAPTNGTTATVTLTGNRTFVRVKGQ